jgi:indolepyruvate decarboxylase
MPSVSEFLIGRMRDAGIKHVFGSSQDTALSFMKKAAHHDLVCVTTSDDLGAGYAADGYARVHGSGCVVVGYHIGAMKVLNAIAAAYAERSPVVVIAVAPPLKEREHFYQSLPFGCQKNIFGYLTAASAVLDDPNQAGYSIDRVFETLTSLKRPVYIELPADVAEKPIAYDVYKQGTPEAPQTDQNTLEEAIEEVSNWLRESKNPVILAGVEVARFGFGTKLMKFAEKSNVLVETTPMSKSVISESHPLNLGVYAGKASNPMVR